MTGTGTKKQRVLHVLGAMNRGGVEIWLMHVLRHLDRERFQMDFVVETDEPGTFDDEIRALGSNVHPCLSPHKPWQYARNFRRIMREHGPYDIVHSHEHHFSGFILRLAAQAGVPMRIVHSHSDTRATEARAGFARRRYLSLMKRWIDRYATVGLAASNEAAAALFRPDWEREPRYRRFYCGIDLDPFRACVDRCAVRAEFGFPPDAFVVGHVGRFTEAKNHPFLIEIMAELVRREPRARLMLVGEGSLQQEIEQLVAQAHLTDHVLFTGVRGDIPRLMRGAMDFFLMPSLFEGLPMVMMEAQAAGLPALLSDRITREVAVIPELVHSLSLEQSAGVWAETVLTLRDAGRPLPPHDAITRMRESTFNIWASIEELERIYGGNTADN